MIMTVLVVAVLSLGLMSVAFRSTVRSLETQRTVQLQLDYDAREQAFLRALVSLTPVYAANTMMEESQRNRYRPYVRFESMYAEAAAMANIEVGLDETMREDLAISDTAKSANVADTSYDDIFDFVGAFEDNRNTTLGAVQGPDSGSYPPPMYVRGLTNSGLSSRSESNDSNSRTWSRQAPLLSSAITYNTTNSAYPEYLGASDEDYPLFNLIPYPNIHFGYGKPGDKIVAKNNWWRIFLHPEVKDMENTRIHRKNEDRGNYGYVDREYVLSLIEIPSQLAISSSSITQLGEYLNGQAWTNVSIQGQLYADKGITKGSFSADGLATRRGAEVSANTQLGTGSGSDLITGGSMSDRETYEASSKKFYPISKSSDTARAMFVAINRGEDFLDRFATLGSFSEDPTSSGGRRMSYENWHQYSMGCNQCAMRLDVTGVVSDVNQTPTEIRFSYFSGGVRVTELFSKLDGTWPNTGTTAGDAFPFQLEALSVGRIGLMVNLELLRTWVATLASAPDGFDVNHSLVVNSDYSQTDVAKPKVVGGSRNSDIALVLRGASDLTAFTKGFSLVTNFRTYIVEDVNNVTTTVPADSGLVAPFYPPFSLYCPEKRFGLDGANTSIEMTGSVGSLNTSSSAIGVLDFKLGGTDAVVASKIQATLKPITHPAALPPVNMMNWLVVIQKVQDGEFTD